MNPAPAGPEGTSSEPANQLTILHPEECAIGAPIRMIGNILFTKLAAGDGGSSISLLQNTISPRNGPPLHAHPFEEFFYILEGTFLFEIGGVSLQAAPGDFVHVPGNAPHVFQNITDREGKLLLIARPGGVEKYFTEVAAQAIHDPRDMAAMQAIGARYGIRIMGPPIAARTKPA
jgi:quercetin dioxygenase-like cupin family protein